MARRLQEDMNELKKSLISFGTQFHSFDSEQSIKEAIEDLKVRESLKSFRLKIVLTSKHFTF